MAFFPHKRIQISQKRHIYVRPRLQVSGVTKLGSHLWLVISNTLPFHPGPEMTLAVTCQSNAPSSVLTYSLRQSWGYQAPVELPWWHSEVLHLRFQMWHMTELTRHSYPSLAIPHQHECGNCHARNARSMKQRPSKTVFWPIFCGKAPSHCISQGRTSSAPMPFLRSATVATAPHAQDNRGKRQPMVKATIAWQDMDMGRRAYEKVIGTSNTSNTIAYDARLGISLCP